MKFVKRTLYKRKTLVSHVTYPDMHKMSLFVFYSVNVRHSYFVLSLGIMQLL